MKEAIKDLIVQYDDERNNAFWKMIKNATEVVKQSLAGDTDWHRAHEAAETAAALIAEGGADDYGDVDDIASNIFQRLKSIGAIPMY